MRGMWYSDGFGILVCVYNKKVFVWHLYLFFCVIMVWLSVLMMWCVA